MKMEITQKKENAALKRTEVHFTIEHSGEPTPKKAAVVDEIVKLTKAKKDCVVLKNIDTVYGGGKSNGYAKVYATKEDAQAVEPQYILKRNGIQKPEYKAPEAAPAEASGQAPAPAEAPKEAPKEEAPKEAPAKEAPKE